MNTDHLKVIWRPADGDATKAAAVTVMRALHALQFAAIAPVIDIHTRQRIA